MRDIILEVKDLKVHFYVKENIVKAVDGASFSIERGRSFGLAGESGSGKTLTALSVMRLVASPGKIVSGNIVFNGSDILTMDEKVLCGIRGSKIAMVFQEPASALNPVFTAGYQIAEAISAHSGASSAKDRVISLLEKVHIPDPQKVYYDYPHQLSGGTKQRIMIAMALANSPELLILDEPTTALDVTIQAQILDLLDEIKAREHISMLFISHDLGVIARVCDTVGIMHNGRIVEQGIVKDVVTDPKDTYTRSLLGSIKALA